MDLDRLWPRVDPAWVLHEDEDLLVAAKPAWVPSQAPVPNQPDDVVARLREWIASRDGVSEADVVLGVHQRLDAGTSGVMVFARSARGNARLAAAFEGRRVEKRYVAGVEGFPQADAVALEHALRLERGRAEVVAPGAPGAKSARLRAAVRERRGPRALVDVMLETGRTHQIRAQFAHEGYPVAGDPRYGGALAPRLMLHAASLALPPWEGAPAVRFESPLPAVFSEWLANGLALPADPRALAARVSASVERRHRLGRFHPETDLVRLVHGAADGLPGVALDRYGDFAVLHLAGDEACALEPALVACAAGLGFRGVYAKRRPKHASTLVDTRTEELAPPEPVWGEAAPEEFALREAGVPYLVRLGDGLSTGIFLDQRENRGRVRARAQGAAVLNLFAYAGAFQVAAVLGGARRTVSVDAAQPATAWNRRNLAAIGADPRQHEVVRGDAFRVLTKLAELGERFDLVIADPPTFATTRDSRFASGADWVRLAAAIAPLLAPGGALVACSNDQRATASALRARVEEGFASAQVPIAEARSEEPPPDFPVAPGTPATLASVWVTRG